MDVFYSNYAGAINVSKNILDELNNVLLLQSLMSCFRTEEIPLLNNKPLKEYRKITTELWNLKKK